MPSGERVYLIALRSGLAYRFGVAWRRDNDLGVAFEERVMLDEDSRDPEQRRLRRLWLDSAMR